jgi:NAD(P)-dependent dehydrogenase (short-subunit alcohol dehydrogenase family)
MICGGSCESRLYRRFDSERHPEGESRFPVRRYDTERPAVGDGDLVGDVKPGSQSLRTRPVLASLERLEDASQHGLWYSTTKYGLRGFTEAVRSELVHEQSAVHVTMVHPPLVNGPFYSHAGSVMEKAPRPPPPVYQPEILGEAIYLEGTVRCRDWRVGEQTTAIRAANQIAPGGKMQHRTARSGHTATSDGGVARMRMLDCRSLGKCWLGSGSTGHNT